MGLINASHFDPSSPIIPIVEPLHLVGAHTQISVDVGARPQISTTDRHRNPEKSRISLWPNTKILQDVRDYCTLNNITFTAFFEQAANQLISGSVSDLKSATCGRAPTPTIDMIGFDSDKTIINLHRKWTQAYNKWVTGKHFFAYPNWTIRDDIVGKRFRDADPRLIEYGLLYCLSKKPAETGTISRFAYYENEINIALSVAPKLSQLAIATMHITVKTKMAAWLNPREEGD